jgi:hypothetical protein
MEGPLTMVVHGGLAALVLFLVMKYVLGQSNSKSLNRSVLAGCFTTSYMILFGHGLPNRLNPNL